MNKKLIAIVPAAGIGTRAGVTVAGKALPKQYRLINGLAMLRLSVQALLNEPRISQVRVILAHDDLWAQDILHDLPRTVLRYCGGETRADTVSNALSELELAAEDWVLVHDAARPGLPAPALARLIDACWAANQGGLLALPVADTVKKAAPADPPKVQATVERGGLWLAQTPQMFLGLPLAQALLEASRAGASVTDEASAMEHAGQQALLIVGSAQNFKVTWPEDFELMEKWL